MLPDFGWSELLVIAIVLIVIVGPKDLPKMLRTFGKTTGSLRKMAGDFRRQFDDALKEAELDDVRQIAKDLKGLDPRNQIKETLSPLGKVGEDISGELKKAASEIEKSDKPKSDTASSTLTADSAKAVEASAAWLDDAKPAAKSKTAKKPAAKSRAPAKSAAKSGSATKTAASRTSAGKTAAAKTTAAKTTAAKPAAAKPAAAKSKASAASKTSTARAKTAAKPKAPAKTTKTAGKDQS